MLSTATCFSFFVFESGFNKLSFSLSRFLFFFSVECSLIYAGPCSFFIVVGCCLKRSALLVHNVTQMGFAYPFFCFAPLLFFLFFFFLFLFRVSEVQHRLPPYIEAYWNAFFFSLHPPYLTFRTKKKKAVFPEQRFRICFFLLIRSFVRGEIHHRL